MEPVVQPAAGCHFTYSMESPEDLAQGDLLRKTDGLCAVLSEVHPIYATAEHSHYLVLTQTCDLVRRGNGDCKSRYITLAAVLPLDSVIRREVERHQQDEFCRKAGVCESDRRFKVEQFVERVMNNNEVEVFYLHAAPELGLVRSECAMLRLTFSLRAYQHYDVCRDARILCLQETFRAKLGWLVGNMYSRVGTEDWVPKYKSRDDFREQVQREVTAACDWFPAEKIQAARRSIGAAYSAMSSDEIVARIRDTAAESRDEVTVTTVISVLKTLGVLTDPAHELQVRTALLSDQRLLGLLRRRS